MEDTDITFEQALLVAFFSDTDKDRHSYRVSMMNQVRNYAKDPEVRQKIDDLTDLMKFFYFDPDKMPKTL